MRTALLFLQVVQHDSGGFSLQTPVLNDDAGASDDLSGLSLLVDLAKSGPFTELLVVVDLDKGDVVFLAEGRNELLVHGFAAVIS